MGVSGLFSLLSDGSGFKGHGNQSANFSGNHLEVNTSLGIKPHQTVIKMAPDGLSTGSSLLLIAGAAAAGAAASGLLVKQQNTPQNNDNRFTLAGQESARTIAKEVMGNM
ncbi:hypothetical protein B7463_g3830, partial [Scytalidium lignicola]